MGHLDSSSERRAYAAHFYRLFGAWRVEWTKSKKSVSDLGLGFVAIAKRRTYCCDTDDRQPTGSVLSSVTVPQEGRFCADSVSKH